MSEEGTIEREIEKNQRRKKGCTCQYEDGDSKCVIHPTCDWCGGAITAWEGYTQAELELCEMSDKCKEWSNKVTGR